MITNKWIPNTTRPPTSVLGYLIAGLALLAMSLPGAVHADDECGAIGSSREVTCGPGNYENGIRYLPGNEGLTLILDQGDGTITVGNPGVHIGSGSDISVIGKDIGTIITEGDYNHALSIVGDTVSNSTLTIEQGNITAKGLHGFGIHFGIRTSGTYAVVVNGGTITGGSVVGAAINVAANDGGTIFVGPGAVIDGSASGFAIRDGILIYDSLSTIV